MERDDFKEWIISLNLLIYEEFRINILDFPDYNYRELYDTGMTPDEALIEMSEDEYSPFAELS